MVYFKTLLPLFLFSLLIVNGKISKFSFLVLQKKFSFKLEDCGVFNQPIEVFLFLCRALRECCSWSKSKQFFSYVVKEFGHSFRCAYIQLWMHLGSLESTQEATVALGTTLTHLSCSPNFPRASITRYTHPKREQILKFHASRRWWARRLLQNDRVLWVEGCTA